MNASRWQTCMWLAAIAAACSSAPPAPVEASAVRSSPVSTNTQGPGTPAAPTSTPRLIRLDNGVTVAILRAEGSEDAQLLFGLLSGTSFAAPGLAELSNETLVEDADPTQGRLSLRQTISRLGGTLQVQVGPLTTWIDMRVPSGRWQDALIALRQALAEPTQSRHQIERIRSALVAQRLEQLRRDPLAATARSLLLGESSPASYLLGLLDRDPGEVHQFQSRLFRPERAILALELPDDPAAVAAALTDGSDDGIGRWLPPTPLPGAVSVMDRGLQSGLAWVEDPAAASCLVGIVMLLPDSVLAGERTAEFLILHNCLTLDGAGGRLEQLQAERGLGHVRWQSQIVQTADSVAVLLAAEVSNDDAGRLWTTLELARRSLRDVPPSLSELSLASRRARLTNRLGQLDTRARLRSDTNMLLRGQQARLFDERLEMLQQLGRIEPSTIDLFLAVPNAMIVVGGMAPRDLADVRRIALTPPGLAATPAREAPRQPDEAANPWLERAMAAVGGPSLLRRMVGFTVDSELVHDRAPTVKDRITWRRDGSTKRTREVLGQTIEADLQGTPATERLGAVEQTLSPKEAEQLRQQQARHPLALLAAFARDEIRFRAIAQRTHGDRDHMVLEAIGDRFDRLRLHIDTISHLVRVVEVWETLPSGSIQHVEESWSDYRSTKGLRVPFRRFATQDDGQNRLETRFTSFEAILQVPE